MRNLTKKKGKKKTPQEKIAAIGSQIGQCVKIYLIDLALLDVLNGVNLNSDRKSKLCVSPDLIDLTDYKHVRLFFLIF